MDGNANLNSPRKSRGMILASWLLILAVAFLVAGMVSVAQFFKPRSMETSAAELLGLNIMAKIMVGSPQSQSSSQLEQFANGPLEQRYGHAILVNETASADDALKLLSKIDEAVEKEQQSRQDQGEEGDFPTESQLKLREILGGLFEQYAQGDFDSSHVTEDDKELLEKRLGWVSNLALTPKESPNKEARREIKNTGFQAFLLMIFAMLFAVFAILGAIVAFSALTAMVLTKNYRVHFENQSKYGFVYVETFAIWILFFYGLQIFTGLFASFLGNPGLGLALSPLAFFGSLVVLAWPLIRGITFRQLRKDIGWELKNPFVETAVGGFSYLALILPMILGVTVSAVLGAGLSLLVSTGEFESSGPVGHPIAEEIASGGWFMWVSIFISACIAAPIVEETMFRGVLYRYLRDATNVKQARWISVVASAIFGGLIFAMIHPQGIVGIPVLTTLAVGFSLVREWRNSLIGPMVMHAINNTLVTCLLMGFML